MRITDKIDVSNHVREEAGQGKDGKDLLKPQKAEKGVEAAVAELLEVLKLEEEDSFTISDDLKNVIRSLAQETGRDEPLDRDIKAFIRALFKDGALKEISGIDISEALNVPGLRDADVVSISNELNSLLKSVIIAGSGEPREIYIPQGAGMSPFLTAIINELFPGWRIRLLKVYRRKRKPLSGKKDSEGEEGKESARQEGRGVNNSLLKGYHANRIRFMATGLIRTADKKDLRFSLELNVTPEGEVREDGITLDPLTIDYGGPSSELDDMKFTFGSEESGNSAFSGAGAGCLIIDLMEVGKAGDGSVIWGPDDSGKGPWVED